MLNKCVLRVGLVALWLLLLMDAAVVFVDATITVVDSDRHYPSMPAVFGKPFSIDDDGTDKAHLQILRENPFLCQGPGLSSLNKKRQLLKEEARHAIQEKEQKHVTNSSTTNSKHHIAPPDGLPVAALVSRGACSFEEKARTAMTYDFVKYVIVYDDRPRSALVPMSATDPDDVNVGMLFVSHTTGIQLKRLIMSEHTQSSSSGGPIVTMDARSPPMPPSYDQTQQWMLAAMAGFFCFMSCFGCLLVGIQTGYIPADGRIVIGPRGIRPAAALTPSRRSLLTEAQVHRLPHQVYVKEQTNAAGGAHDNEDNNPQHHSSGCAICIEEFQDGETLQVLPCSHKFHTDCIVPWLTERQASCPLCKHIITSDDVLEQQQGARGVTGWFWSSWRNTSGRTIVPTEEQVEEDNITVTSSPASPTLVSSAGNEENEDVVVPVEST